MRGLICLVLLCGCSHMRDFEPVELNGYWYIERVCDDGSISARCAPGYRR